MTESRTPTGGAVKARVDAAWAALAPTARHGLLTLAFVAGVYFIVAAGPEWLASPDDLRGNELAEERGRVRTALLAVAAGTIALVGAFYTARTFALNRQGQITERFTRAVEQLGHDRIDVRLGGIYALERLARESQADHGPIVEILTAYIRERAPGTLDDGSKPKRRRIATDVQAAITVLGRRRVGHDPPSPWRLDLADADLRGVDLSHGHFQNAYFVRSRLDGASLVAGRFARAFFVDAGLDSANLVRAEVAEAHFLDADLTNANLTRVDAVGAIFYGANLERASLHDANLRDADFSEADLTDARLLGADLEGAYVDGVKMKGVVYNNDTAWPSGFDASQVGARLVKSVKRQVTLGKSDDDRRPTRPAP